MHVGFCLYADTHRERRPDMNTRVWIGSALLALFALAAPLSAQPEFRFFKRPKIIVDGGGSSMRGIDPVGDRPSHLPLHNGLEEERSPERLMAERLLGARELKRLQDIQEAMNLNGDMERLARKLLQDPKFLESMKNRFTPEDLERLVGKFQRGEKLTSDPALQDLLRKGLAGNQLSERDRDLLSRWAERLKDRNGVRPPFDGSDSKPVPENGEQGKAPQTGTDSTPGPDGPAPQAPWDRLPEGSSDWFKKNVDGLVKGLDRWVDSPSGRSWTNTFKDWAKRAAEQPRNPAVTEPLRRFRSVLPRLSDYFPRGTPRITAPNLPRLPRVSAALPSAPNVSGGALAGAGRILLWGILLGAIAFLVWQSASWWKRHREALAAAGWRLGPWPVQPGAVSTRGDLVRAFEYLALLCLGPAARTCHHLELGQRIGNQPAVDADRHRDAAHELARLYEQARYTPDEEPLSAEDLARARRDLSYLAGVPAA
jgi:hypothetical protein